MKKKMMIALTLAMMTLVLAAGTAHAGTRPLMSLTNSPSQSSVKVGDTVHFYVTLTNNDPLTTDVSGQVTDALPANVKFVSAYSPQGPCSFEPGGANGSGTVSCDPGNLAPGESTQLDIAVVPQKAGIITNVANDSWGNEASASVEVHPAQNSPAPPPVPHGKAVAQAGGAVAIAG